MRKLAKVLEGSIESREVLRTARAQKVLRRWEEVVGPGLAKRSWPDRFERGTVWVAVEGSVWAQELRMVKDRILSRLAEMSGEPEMFRDVRFGVRQRPVVEVSEAEKERGRQKHKNEIRHLTIAEIRERRLKEWEHEAGS